MPVVFIEAPPGIKPEAKKQMVQKITAAIDEAYHIGDTLIFLREYSAENVAVSSPRIQRSRRCSRRSALETGSASAYVSGVAVN